MIERVGGSPNYDYPKVNGQRSVSQGTEGEKFSLDYESQGVAYEPSNAARTAAQSAGLGKEGADVNQGVLLTLSEEAKKPEEVKESSFSFAKLQDWWQKTVELIKSTWSKIWDTPSPNNAEVIDNIDETDSRFRMDSADATDGIDAIDSRDATSGTDTGKTTVATSPHFFAAAKAEAEQFLTENAGKQPLRRSDLLTYYDKHGTIVDVDVDASDKQRILYGDRSQLKG